MRTPSAWRASGGSGSPPADESGTPLEHWLRELERLDGVLAAQSEYLDAVESGEPASPPPSFVGTEGLPELPAPLVPYARDLVERNEAVTRRAMTLSAQLRPRQQRPMHVRTSSARGAHFEQQA